MKTSVLIPTRNRPAWLRFSILSILRQTMRPYEILVLADDNEFLEENKKIVDALAVGIHIGIFPFKQSNIYQKIDSAVRYMASGQIIVQADDDDFHCPLRLETQTHQIKSGADVCHVVFPLWALHGSDKVYRLSVNNHPAKMIQGSTFAYRRSAYLEAGGYPIECGTTHDKALANCFLKAEKNIVGMVAGDPLQIAFEHGGNYWSGYRNFSASIYQETEYSVRSVLGNSYSDLPP